MKSQAQILRDHRQEVFELRIGGVQTKEIAKRYGVSNNVVKAFLKVNRIEIQPFIGRNEEELVIKNVRDKTGGAVEYVSGYTTKEKPIVVRCMICRETFERTYHHLTTHFTGCPICKAKVREEARKEKEKAERERRNAIKESKREEQERQKRESKEARRHPCPVCGELTTRKKYCSDECMRKAMNTQHEIRRRHKIRGAMVDRDITLEGLYKRDKGRCHICGLGCSYEDYTVKGGTFIAGDWYPSIDHVIPLSAGGKHSWQNVKLAHRGCNVWKSDKIFLSISPRS